MIVALPLFGSEISPRFDCAGEFLLVNVEGGKIAKSSFIGIQEGNPIQRARLLLERKVDKVICGGIDDFSSRLLNGLGIEVVPWVAGDVRKVIEKLLKEGKEEGSFDPV